MVPTSSKKIALYGFYTRTEKDLAKEHRPEKKILLQN